MPTTVFSSDAKRLHRGLVAGVGLLFIILLGVGYWLYRGSDFEETTTTTINQTVGSAPTVTPEELKISYLTAVTKVQSDWSATQSTDQKTTILDQFFFSTRVPEEMLKSHLDAMLKTKSATSTETVAMTLADLVTTAQSTLSK
jgi:hypothetical protein